MGRILNWLAARPLPRRITLTAWEDLWYEGLWHGATAASLFWIALILFALMIGAVARKVRR
jgi:D-alanyl-lipoteichoic acid acyltransferase DltB (MBOAT superfamily)